MNDLFKLPKEATGQYISPSIRTRELYQQEFNTIRQGTDTNKLTKIRPTEKNTTIDSITGTATIKQGDVSISIPHYNELAGLRTSTYQLLDAITVQLTETGAKSPTVTLTLEEYMRRRGLKDRKEAKNQAKADMELLRQASFTIEEKTGKDTSSYRFVNLADSGEIKRNGDIVFTYGQTFYQALLKYPVMPYPALLQMLNAKNNPNSYYLLRKISELKNMNIGKRNEDIVSVSTLLSVSPSIPSYEEVMKGNRNLTKRIIDPFTRDMDALEDALTWEFCHKNNKPLTDEELIDFNFSIFKDLNIKIHWKNYPDQTERLAKIAEKKAKTEKQRKATTRKKKTS